MRLIFTFRATEKVSISYLAHSHGGKNGTAYQTTSELNRNKNNMEGLLELLHYDYDSYKHPPTISLDNTFSHFGIVVPCVTRFQKRVDKLKLPILKRAGGEMTQEALEAVAKSHGLRKMWEENKLEAESLLLMLLESIPGFSDFIFMTDPDGNLIEVQPQELPQIPL
ncbi:hypothetical protein GX51_06922 [Blastomyces parvus]|uniref:Uncharacterized protein n=1 Tax=Blastomyces parvus TaxID=2060905 RepID=A0A2B7WNK2_9EURO|nr:hypothetical protein GX51_06922 [Blastomyces parvus]